jgi:hypothetical protein
MNSKGLRRPGPQPFSSPHASPGTGFAGNNYHFLLRCEQPGITKL